MVFKSLIDIKFSGILLICILCSADSKAQLKGNIVDDKSSPVAFVNVAVLKVGDSTLMKGSVSDAQGNFNIPAVPAGKYFLKITSIGYAEKRTDAFELTDAGSSKDIGTVVISAKSKSMKEVAITSLRPQITQLPDRMVVTIEGTALAAGNTAFEVLTKAPGVFVDQDGNITINGRAGITVMLDGKQTYLSAADLRTMLQSMSAENVKNIEVITNPSAKYDAEGTSGILNINLKKNNQKGFNGSLSAGYNYNGKQHGYTSSGNINYKSGNWNMFLNSDMSRRVSGREATFTRIFYGTNQTLYFDQLATGNNEGQGPPTARAGVDYTINRNQSIGFVGYYSNSKGYSDFLTDTYIGTNADRPNQYINADNFNKSRFTNATLNGHYTAKLDSIGSTFSTDVDYVRISNRREGNFYNYFTDLNTNRTITDFLYTFLPSHYDIYSGKIDVVKAYKNGSKIETGVKASQVTSDNDSRFYFNNGSLVIDPKRTNHFNYREKIYAAYLNWSGNLSKKLTLQAGLRTEHTDSKGISYTTGQVTDRGYTDLFPSIFLQHKINPNYSIAYIYTRRLTRPNYGNLNPFRSYRDPYTWEQGNPYLRPQYTDGSSINQTIKKVYGIILTYNHNRDVMSELPILNADSATTIYTTGNVDHGDYASIYAVAPLRIMKNWESQNSMSISYNKLAIMVDNKELINDRVSFFIQNNNTIQLTKTLRLELSTWYRAPTASGLYIVHAMWRTDIGLKKSFFNKKLDVTINGNDLFKGQRFIFTTDINGNKNDFNQYFRFRSVGVNVRWNFSKGVKVEEKKRAKVEELDRT